MGMGKKRSILLRMALILIVLFFSSGCQKKQERVEIAFSACEENTSRSIAMIRDIITAAEEGGRTVELRCADNDLEQQEEDIQELMALQPGCLLVTPVKTIGLEKILNEVSAAGIPVIIVDRNMEQSSYQDYLTQISADAYEEGKMCARKLGEFFAGKSARVLEIQGRQGSSLSNDRSRGFRDALCEYENMEIADVVYGNSDRIQANHSVKEYLNQGGTFDAVFGHSDEEGLGALMALRDRNEDRWIPIVSVNGQQEVREALLCGNYLATVYADPQLGDEVMDVITDYEEGNSPDRKVIIPDLLYDQENAASLQEY